MSPQQRCPILILTLVGLNILTQEFQHVQSVSVQKPLLLMIFRAQPVQGEGSGRNWPLD